MNLYLHITCSCIFIHTYLQVSIFVILYLVGAFLIVFLSPSLSISYVSCVMAYKQKFIPSWNPLRFEASSSSSPSDLTPSYVWFHDMKDKSDFSEKFSWRGIHSECQVVLSNFFDIVLPIVIHSRGWESPYGILVTCPSVIIQEFYSNMHRFDYSIPQFVTRIWGIRMVVTPNIVSEVVHPNYLGYERLRTMYKDELLSILWDTFFMGWSLKHLKLSLC